MSQNNPLSLSSPVTLKSSQVIKNRLVKSAMSEVMADKNHNPTAEHICLYRTWAEGGIGLQVTGNVMIDRTHLGEPNNVVLDSDQNIELFRQWAEAGKTNGAHFWMQLNHPGRQSPMFLNRSPVAPSIAKPEGNTKGLVLTARALSHDEIEDIIERFANSAELAKRAGFSGVQIHGAHGYLVNQFLSPKTNQRSDQWGGSFEKRTRFVLEVYRAIRQRVGDDYPVGIKLNSADFQRGGFSEEESMKVAELLDREGIDLIEVSGGNYESAAMSGDNLKDSTLAREAYFIDYAEAIRKRVKAILVVTGGFRSHHGMQNALESGATDLIGMARPLSLDPELPKKILASKQYAIHIKQPTTGIRMLDKRALLDITWYENQLHLIGRGLSPNPNLNAFVAVYKMFKSLGAAAFKKRRT